MERRALLAAGIAVVFLIGYQWAVVRLYPPPPPGTSVPVAAAPASPDALVASPTSPSPRALGAPETRQTLASPTHLVDISSDGGTVASVTLRQHTDPVRQQPIVATQPVAVEQRLGFLTGLTINGATVAEPAYALTTVRDGVAAQATVEPGLQITKHYALRDGLLHGRLQLTNTSRQTLTVGWQMITSAPLTAEADGPVTHVQGLVLAGDRAAHTPATRAVKQPVVRQGTTQTGQVSRYFALLAVTSTASDETILNSHKDNGLSISSRWPAQRLAPGDSGSVEVQWYVGPREYRQVIATLRPAAILFPQGLLSTLGTWLLDVMRWLHGLTHNYGIAIICLTLLVGAALFPLTWMNLRMSRTTMAQMQFIQPKLERLKEQYKDNPQKLNREMMELYKKHKINPLSQLGGCLPLLLQMPIFIALYNTIGNSLELRGATFLWIRDLAAPDQAWTVAGFAVNVLPLLMMAAMFAQQQLSPIKPAATTPGMPNMTTMMAVMFGIMFYGMPSALVLYWLTNTLFMTGVYLAAKTLPAPPTAA